MNNIEEAYHRALPIGWEKDGLAFGLWSGMERVERMIWSPVYFVIMLWMWFNGCFRGQDYHFVPTQEREYGQKERDERCDGCGRPLGACIGRRPDKECDGNEKGENSG